MRIESAPRPTILVGQSRPPVFGRGWAAAAGSWLRERLARRSAGRVLAALSVIVLLPTVWSGLVIDDFFHRLVVEQKSGAPIGRFDLFDFISSNLAVRERFEELGIYPWWIGPHTQVSYFRPLAALTHFVDYSWWPKAAWLMHAENLAWYVALVLACTAFYRRFIAEPWVAGLAIALYALDHAHAYPVAWVANRNALMATFFGVLSLLAHDRWRTGGKSVFGAVACAALALALLSAEAGLAIAGYTAAYALTFERGWRRRALSVLPCLFVVVAWRWVYRALGHGAVNSGANLDPLLDRAAFALHALQTGPLLLASDVTGMPADALFEHPRFTVAAALGAVAVLGALGYAVFPSLRHDRSSRFFAAGAVMSVVPLGGTFPSDRYLFWAGLGVMGLIAQLIGGVFGERPWPARSLRSAVCLACIFLRGLVSPAAFPFRAAGPGIVEDDYERMIESIPRGPLYSKQTVVILNAPVDLFGMCLPIVAMAKGAAMPAHTYMLYAGTGDVTVSRSGRRVLEVRSERGWLSRFTDRIFRNGSLRLDETVDLEAMSARVVGLTPDGRPRAVRFAFPTDLDDAALLFLSWGPHGFDPVTLPPEGADLTVEEAPLLVSDVLRPHLRARAVEDDR